MVGKYSAIWGVLGSVVGALLALAIVTCVGDAVDPEPESPGPSPLPEADGAITEIAMHWSPEFRTVVWEAYTDFWAALPAGVRLQLVTPEGFPRASQEELLREISARNADLARNVEWVRTPGPITTWSKDRALVARAAAGRPTELLVPPEPDPKWLQRRNDWRSVRALAESSGGRFRMVSAPFDFDAGDFVVTDREVIVGANLLAKNARRDIRDVQELRRRLEAWLKRPVLVLGNRPEDVPDHHLAMTMTPLVGNVVLVGDPRAAQALVGKDFEPGARSPDTGQPLVADFSPETVARFDRLASDLEKAHYQVVRIPNVPFDAKTYLTYTNGVYEVRDGKRIAYLPHYGVRALDEAASKVYRDLGWTIQPIRVRRVFPYHGTIGCLVNVLSRSP